MVENSAVEKITSKCMLEQEGGQLKVETSYTAAKRRPD